MSTTVTATAASTGEQVLIMNQTHINDAVHSCLLLISQTDRGTDRGTDSCNRVVFGCDLHRTAPTEQSSMEIIRSRQRTSLQTLLDVNIVRGLDQWVALDLDLQLEALQLVHWEEPKKTAAAFGLSLLVLVSVATLSVISVVSYLLLTCLCVTITFRVYKAVIQAVQKSDEGHPFRSLLEKDISVSSESVRLLADQSLVHLNWFSGQTRRLLLVEDLVDSLKLAAVMWLLTYVGSIFNGVTLLILADIIFFTTPLIYQKKKVQIDHHIEMIRSRVEEMLHRLQDRLPGAVKRTKAE